MDCVSEFISILHGWQKWPFPPVLSHGLRRLAGEAGGPGRGFGHSAPAPSTPASRLPCPRGGGWSAHLRF
jgi:hypothetical protein